jgi:hypothetical protein
MNREPDKEIEILLRRLSRQQSDNLAADGNSAALPEEHLDADELNAYAEQALPPTLRARYTEHLADCGRCRSIVTQLSQSAPAVMSAEVVDQRGPSRLRTFLASLFSPLVIRYAVPAMAVIVVAAIAWIAVRRSPGPADIALNTERRQETPATSPERAPFIEPAKETNAAATADSQKNQENKQASVSRHEAPDAATTASKATDEVKEAESQVKQAEPPPPAAAPAGATTGVAASQPAGQADKNEAAVQKKIDADLARAQATADQERRTYARAQKAGPSPSAKTPNQEAEPKTNESASVARRERGALAGEKQKDQARDDDAETRTVAGHRFKRRGSIWTDVLYDSNQSTVNVSRGSEQYRALVGDEPDLRRIAEELSGTIIVVWKNRAYRIR